MELTTGVSLNTSLADLDEALRTLLRRELAEVGFAGVNVAFEAPDREWAATLTGPTVNLFLYDLRENRRRRQAQWDRGDGDGRRTETRPPLWLDASYTLTAFARAVEDEHRLLSQALIALYDQPQLPADVLPAALTELTGQLGPLRTRLGDPELDASADFWSAVGGPFKPSFHYIVTVPFPSGAVLRRGPPVRTQRLSLRDRAAPAGAAEQRVRIAGAVVDPRGAPVARAWVALSELGLLAESDENGRFAFEHVRAGTYTIRARDPSGREAEASVAIPGSPIVLRVAG